MNWDDDIPQPGDDDDLPANPGRLLLALLVFLLVVVGVASWAAS